MSGPAINNDDDHSLFYILTTNESNIFSTTPRHDQQISTFKVKHIISNKASYFLFVQAGILIVPSIQPTSVVIITYFENNVQVRMKLLTY